MDTVANVRKRLVQSLRSFGIDEHEARREADLIVEHASGLSVSQQMLKAEEILEPRCLETIDRIQQQRQSRMPLQYCLGESWFMGLRFRVNSDVLIPRADTETLVQRALELAKNQFAPSLLDVGTGSGAIAVALLKARPDARVVALDISSAALAVALTNARAHDVQDRLELVCQDWEQFESTTEFDGIVSNPPYIPLSLEPELQPEVSVFEPKQALFGSDTDGLGFYRSLSINARQHIKPGGFITVEVGQDQAPAVEDIFRNRDWLEVGSRLDLNGISRVVSAFRARLTIENLD